MATSGSTDFTQTRNEIIQDAFQLIGVYGVGRTISSEDQVLAERTLNRMVKAWQADGLHVFATEEAYLFGTKSVAEYQLGAESTDTYLAPRAGTRVTKIRNNEVASQNTLDIEPMDSLATIGEIIGVTQDDGTIHWSTVAAQVIANQIVVFNALTEDASVGNHVYIVSSRISVKPLKIKSLRRVDGINTDASALEMTQLSQEEYFNFATKNMDGAPSSYYYNPDLVNGRLYLWPRPEGINSYFEITYSRPFEDFDGANDTPDFPTEWLEAIVYNLAYRLAPSFGADKNSVQPEAELMYQRVLDWSCETTSVRFMPESEY